MKTKYTHTTQLISANANPIIQVFFDFAQLKNLFRQGWIKHGVSEEHCESVADHCFGVAILGYVIANDYRPDLDPSHVMKLGLFHECGEIFGGDITPRDGVNLEEKSQREYASVQRVFSSVPGWAEKYTPLWLEFERQATPEARFTKQIDRLEMAFQANLYERLGYTCLDDYFPDVKSKLTSPELKAIFDDLLRIR